MKKEEIFATSLFIYIACTQLFSMHFWYLWAQHHGFLSTVFVGPIVAEIKGFLFPFFI